jgi:hypothetical protein
VELTRDEIEKVVRVELTMTELPEQEAEKLARSIAGELVAWEAEKKTARDKELAVIHHTWCAGLFDVVEPASCDCQ